MSQFIEMFGNDKYPLIKLGNYTDLTWGDTKTTKNSYVPEGYLAYSASGPDGKLDHFDYDCEGIVLSAIGADCGKTWFASGKWSCIKNTIRFWSISDELDNRFLYFATREKDFWPRRGGAQPFIPQGDARDCSIPLPPISLQRKFVEIAEQADKSKFVGFKSQFIEMFNGDFPYKLWEDCLTITNGKKYPEEYSETRAYPVCGSGGIMGYGDHKLCSKNTTILGRKGNINSPIYMDTDYWIVDTAFSLDVNHEKLHPKYFYYWCILFDFTKYNKQGVLPSLTKNDLLKIVMPIPPMNEQIKFVQILEQADKSKYIS